MFQKKWQICIGDEVWEFETLKDFKKILDDLININEKYGKEVSSFIS